MAKMKTILICGIALVGWTAACNDKSEFNEDSTENPTPLINASTKSEDTVSLTTNLAVQSEKRFIPEKIVTNDPGYVISNTSNYSVSVLYDYYGVRIPEETNLVMTSDALKDGMKYRIKHYPKSKFFFDLNICISDSGVIRIKPVQIAFKYDGIYLNTSGPGRCETEIKGVEYRNSIKNGKNELENIHVSYKGMYCQDTGENQIIIKDAKGVVELKDILNACIFKYDLNDNGIDEIYVFAFQCCTGWLRVFKLEQT